MERQRKRLKELTIKDNFMFAAVMLEPENAKGLLELALGIEVEHVEISYEKSIVYNPEYKGVRLDVYLKDELGRHINVEMQATSRPLLKRARYYHSQIDMELLVSGEAYEYLPDSYVLFICDFDPIGLKKYKYTVTHSLKEESGYEYVDGNHTVFLSTAGTNNDDVSEALVKFLKFVAADSKTCEDNYNDEYVKQLQNSVKKIKISRDMEARYMVFEEMMRNEYNTGKEDGKIEGEIKSLLLVLESRFSVSDNLKEKIKSITDDKAVCDLIAKAASADSLNDFIAEMERNNL